MIELSPTELRSTYLLGVKVRQDEESVQIAKKINQVFDYKVFAVYKYGGIHIVVHLDGVFGINKAIEIGVSVATNLNIQSTVYIYTYKEMLQKCLIGCFTQSGFPDKNFYFLPQAEKIYKTKGYEKNWMYIYNGQYELNIFYKNSWKLKKAIKDGSAEALRESILEVVAKYDKEKMFNKDNFPINFCNMRKYNMFTESRG